MKKIIALITILLTSQAFAVGFEHGNNFGVIELQGSVFVRCNPIMEPPSQVFHNCYTQVLTPAEFSRIKANVDADRVEIIATDRDGETEEKSSKFKKGYSKKEFNLWIDTLFQDPLLNFGQNQIEYLFTKDGKEVASGQFMVDVSLKDSRTCPQGSLTSNRDDDCRQFSKANVCWEYFRLYNFCK